MILNILQTRKRVHSGSILKLATPITSYLHAQYRVLCIYTMYLYGSMRLILLKTQALASRRQSLAGCESSRDGSILAWSTFNSRLSQKQKIANKDPKDQKKHPFFQFRVQAQNTLFFDFEYKLMKTTLFLQYREHFMFANMLKKRPLFTRNLERSCVHEVNTEWQHRAVLLKTPISC